MRCEQRQFFVFFLERERNRGVPAGINNANERTRKEKEDAIASQRGKKGENALLLCCQEKKWVPERSF